VAAGRPAAEVVREGARPARDHNLPLLLAGTMVTVGIAAADATDGRIVGGTAVLAVFTVLALTLRIQLVAREKDALARRLQASLAEQQRLAVTDGLTGLHNRRFVEEVLAIEAARAGRDGTSLGLIVIDLDRFKQVNDSLGHPAGDAVLAEAARRLASVVRAGDVVARYGGEEFVVVLPRADGQALAQVAERCRAAVAGAPFAAGEASITVTASAGGARMPEDAADVEELVRIADRSLYAAKALGRNQVQIAATGLGPILADDDSSSVVAFLETLSDEIDRRQTGDPHSEPMAAVAASVAARLGLSVGAQRRVALAARFHDLGKVCVPDAILLKPGPLEAREWAIVREHPERGAEIIGLAADLRDVAPGVRAHHERWDGAGYPDRLRGEAIPVEARIVAVCDAWFAMRADRPHRPALDRDEARAELGAGAGTQFDPQVVEAFLAIEPETTKGRLSPAGPS
jgi:diguanylate cyclase (GGDEF)-like protein